MKTLLFLAPILFSVGVLANTSYEDTIRAVAYNQRSDVNDGSTGSAWFNLTESSLSDYGFDMLDRFSLYSNGSFNYLVTLTSLAAEAQEKGYFGDVVFLMFEFLYIDEPSTAIDPGSAMVKHIGQLLKRSKEKRIDEKHDLATHLIDTSSIPEVKKLYEYALASVPLSEKSWDIKIQEKISSWRPTFDRFIEWAEGALLAL